MFTLAEIKKAADALPEDQQRRLLEWLSEQILQRESTTVSPHSVLDIAPVSLGEAIRPLNPDVDLLGEMLE